MTNIAKIYMAYRNRWFTVLKNGGLVDLSMANCECHSGDSPKSPDDWVARITLGAPPQVMLVGWFIIP